MLECANGILFSGISIPLTLDFSWPRRIRNNRCLRFEYCVLAGVLAKDMKSGTFTVMHLPAKSTSTTTTQFTTLFAQRSISFLLPFSPHRCLVVRMTLAVGNCVYMSRNISVKGVSLTWVVVKCYLYIVVSILFFLLEVPCPEKTSPRRFLLVSFINELPLQSRAFVGLHRKIKHLYFQKGLNGCLY